MISFVSCLKVKFSNIVFRLVRNGSRIIYYIFFWKICLLLIPSPKTINAKMMWKFLHKPFKVCCVPDLIIKIILTSYKLPKIAVTFWLVIFKHKYHVSFVDFKTQHLQIQITIEFDVLIELDF